MANPDGALSGLAKTEVFGLPVGAAATGALVAGAFDGLSGILAGVAPQLPSWAIKGVGAWAASQWGPGVVGTEAARVAGLLLTYDAVQEFINLRGMLRGIFAGVRLGTPAGAAAGASGAPPTEQAAWDAIR